MTHTKFIELLNLYLDHEITMEDAATLEAEIQRDPKRRAIYRQYCAMHKGCEQLAGAFANDRRGESRQVPAAAAPRRTLPGWVTGLGMAAAACAAFAFVFVSRQGDVPAPTVAAVEPTATTTPATSVYSLAELNARPALHAVYTPTLVNLSRPTANASQSEFYAATTGEAFDWMDQVKLAPVENDEFSFRVRPVVVEGSRTYRSHRPYEGNAEMTAFQFQR